eukprot:2286432-Pyramimonas_sp.AAC.1
MTAHSNKHPPFTADRGRATSGNDCEVPCDASTLAPAFEHVPVMHAREWRIPLPGCSPSTALGGALGPHPSLCRSYRLADRLGPRGKLF